MTAALDYLPTWDGTGLCAGRPDLMADPDMAMTLCLGDDLTDGPCPVLDACRAWVLAIPIHEGPDGVVAGLTFAEREQLILDRLPPLQCTDCGQTKPQREFAQNTEGRPGRRACCRLCMYQRTSRAKRGAPT